jgi:outer membrane protein assembly factor BamD (BamD/ComL family)
MRSKLFCSVIGVVCLSFFSSQAEAGITIKNGKIVDLAEVPTMSAADHYDAGLNAMEASDWNEASTHFRIIEVNFPNSTHGQDASYFLGVALFEEGELDLANEAFSRYLKMKNNPRFFLETIQYKFEIAERFSSGARRRFLGSRKFPKWATGRTIASQVYDEVITAMPSHELAAKALYSKGMLLWKNRDYKGSVEAFQNLTRRFPKNELAPEAYLAISKVYVDQSRVEFQNPDIISLAMINLRRFKQDFPKETRSAIVEKDVFRIKEIHAHGIYQTGQFFERTGKPQAAAIYYENAIRQFPETRVAEGCRQRLENIKPSDSQPRQATVQKKNPTPAPKADQSGSAPGESFSYDDPTESP